MGDHDLAFMPVDGVTLTKSPNRPKRECPDDDPPQGSLSGLLVYPLTLGDLPIGEGAVFSKNVPRLTGGVVLVLSSERGSAGTYPLTTISCPADGSGTINVTSRCHLYLSSQDGAGSDFAVSSTSSLSYVAERR
jgi:hypothetical protein